MNTERFHEPQLALNRIYTRRGDDGETNLVGGQRVAKDALRIECYGTVDELGACIGLALVSAFEEAGRHPEISRLAGILRRVQHELFNLGSVLATLPDEVGPQQPRILPDDVLQLEREMDSMNEVLPALRSFVLPGGSRLNAELHLCRTVCRRAERICVALLREEQVPSEAVRYLNRLSDALFVFSRWANHIMRTGEVLWEPNQAGSAH